MGKNPLLIILIGTIVWSLTMVKSGLVYSYGMGFWGPNGHDGVWHISLISSLSRFNLQIPIFAGSILKNYHFGLDLILAAIHLITRIEVRFLYFQLLPPILAFGIGYYAFKFIFSWTRNYKASLWSLFFVYFGGSFGWLVNLFRGKGLGGESMFWSQQSISTLINPPFALSILIIFYCLYCMSKFSTKVSSPRLITTSILIGSLTMIKIYAAILFLPGLAIASIFEPRFRKLFILSVFISLLFYLPFNWKATSLVVFQPFWFLENMLALSDRFNWLRLYQAMTAYKATHNLIKFIPAYSLAALIFIIGNLGFRITGFLYLINHKKFNPIEIILWVMAGLGFLLPLFFVQRGTPWNTIQFFYYTQFIIGLFTARWIAARKNFLLIGSCILLTIPTTIDTLKHYLPSNPPAKISHLELSALKFLSDQPAGVVFTPPVRPDPYSPAPRPLYLYESTAYVSAFSNHPVYLEDTVNLDITGYPWKDRLNESNQFMSNTNIDSTKSFLSANKIRYLYLPQVATVRPNFSASQLGGEVIYENSQVSIWQIE